MKRSLWISSYVYHVWGCSSGLGETELSVFWKNIFPAKFLLYYLKLGHKGKLGDGVRSGCVRIHHLLIRQAVSWWWPLRTFGKVNV